MPRKPAMSIERLKEKRHEAEVTAQYHYNAWQANLGAVQAYDQVIAEMEAHSSKERKA